MEGGSRGKGEDCRQEFETTGHIASATRKQRQILVLSPLPPFYSTWDLDHWICVFSPQLP